MINHCRISQGQLPRKLFKWIVKHRRSNIKLCHLSFDPYFSVLFDHNYFHFQSKRCQVDPPLQRRENDRVPSGVRFHCPFWALVHYSIKLVPFPFLLPLTHAESTTVTTCTHLRLSSDVNLTASWRIFSNLMSNLLTEILNEAGEVPPYSRCWVTTGLLCKCHWVKHQ